MSEFTEEPKLSETSPSENPKVEVASETPVVVEEQTNISANETKPDTTVKEIVDEFQSLNVNKSKSIEEIKKIQAKDSYLSAGIPFTHPSLKIPKPILDSLTLEMKFEKPSEIQASTLPLIIDRHNVIAQAQCGAGKTIAFVIGMLSQIDTNIPYPQALCLTPTRELANQILHDAVMPLSTRIVGIRAEDALPGRDIPSGVASNSHIIVGTPGTVKKWIMKNYLIMKYLRVFVLDEADKMVEEKALGADTIFIRNKLPPTAQILMFSATYTPEIINYARKLAPRSYVVTPRKTEELVLDVIFQVKMDVNKCPGKKLQVLTDIYDFMTLQQSIIFIEKKADVDKVAQLLRSAGLEISVLHGSLEYGERDRIMEDFRSGRTKVLITTNVLARGVDVPAVAVVVNYDIPITKAGNQFLADTQTYLHRIGRCSRFGRRGTAINLLETPEDFRYLQDIETFYSPTTPMISEWDPNDIPGLTDAIQQRPEGGEINITAIEGNTGSVHIAVLN